MVSDQLTSPRAINYFLFCLLFVSFIWKHPHIHDFKCIFGRMSPFLFLIKHYYSTQKNTGNLYMPCISHCDDYDTHLAYVQPLFSASFQIGTYKRSDCDKSLFSPPVFYFLFVFPMKNTITNLLSYCHPPGSTIFAQRCWNVKRGVFINWYD